MIIQTVKESCKKKRNVNQMEDALLLVNHFKMFSINKSLILTNNAPFQKDISIHVFNNNISYPDI